MGEIVALDETDWKKIRKLKREGKIIEIDDTDECEIIFYAPSLEAAKEVKKAFNDWPEPVEIEKGE